MKASAPGEQHQHCALTALWHSKLSVSCLTVQVAEDLIWVWGSSGPSEHIHAAAKRPNVTREADNLPAGQKLTEVFKMYTRDLPYDWQVRRCMPVCNVCK